VVGEERVDDAGDRDLDDRAFDVALGPCDPGDERERPERDAREGEGAAQGPHRRIIPPAFANRERERFGARHTNAAGQGVERARGGGMMGRPVTHKPAPEATPYTGKETG
jgi:hypothetical protein